MDCLSSLHVIEFSGLGPAPFAAMTLADMGARVTRITRAAAKPGAAVGTFINRNRHDVPIDLKTAAGIEEVKAFIENADVLIEGFRPGKMESLGLGPGDLAQLNPRLVYARMTGWGQSGPMAHLAGHDINYLALSGVLSLLGEAGRPPLAPLNLVADFGGGGMYLAFGIVSAVTEARATGTGRIVDASMVHGVTHLSSLIQGWAAAGRWNETRQTNLLDGGAPFYRCYETSDGRYMAVGALEAGFFKALVQVLRLDEAYIAQQNDRNVWQQMGADMSTAFSARPLDHWITHFDNVDACVTPVLTLDEAKAHPQMARCFVIQDGMTQPAPAPRILPLDELVV